MTTTEKQNEKAILKQLLSVKGYKGFRITESNYNREYNGGAFAPEYLSNGGDWKEYSTSTKLRYSVKSGMKSQVKTYVTYKTAKGAMNYLLKHGLEAKHGGGCTCPTCIDARAQEFAGK